MRRREALEMPLGNKWVSVRAADKTGDGQSGACARLAVLTLSGTGRALAERGLLHTSSPVPCFHAKLGAGGTRWSPVLCVLPLWCQRGIPTGGTLLALADPAFTLRDPTSGSRAECLGALGGFWELLMTRRGSRWGLGQSHTHINEDVSERLRLPRWSRATGVVGFFNYILISSLYRLFTRNAPFPACCPSRWSFCVCGFSPKFPG